MEPNYSQLKSRQRNDRDTYPINMGLRVHRALSWLDRAEQCENDLDAEFIFLWISFNAAYANEIDDHRRFTGQDIFQNFLNRLCDLDINLKICNLIWTEFTCSIRVLLDNKYVFQPFWDIQNKKIDEAAWQTKFALDIFHPSALPLGPHSSLCNQSCNAEGRKIDKQMLK
jgi:hypothetical protein